MRSGTPFFLFLLLSVTQIHCSEPTSPADTANTNGFGLQTGDFGQFGGGGNPAQTPEITGDAGIAPSDTLEEADGTSIDGHSTDTQATEDTLSDTKDSTEPDGVTSPTCTGEEVLCEATQECCASDQQCVSYGCAPTAPSCDDSSTCQNDTYCEPEAGTCIPWGTGPNGTWSTSCAKDVSPGVFFPTLQCAWDSPPEGDAFPNHKSVLGSAVTGRITTPGAPLGGGASNTSGGPVQIAFVSYAGTDGGLPSASCCGIIRVIDGATCETLHTLGEQAVVGGSNLALGDLNLDGRPEIVALAEGGGLVAFSYEPDTDGFVVLWRSTQLDGITPDTYPGASVYQWNGPSIGDVVGDSHPEILHDGALYRWDGVQISDTPGWSGYAQGVFPVTADANLDGVQDVFFGPQPLNILPGTDTLVGDPSYVGNTSPGHIALADFGDYPGADESLPPEAAEKVVVRSGQVHLEDHTGQVLMGPISLPGGGNGGPPTIADFDGDGLPEFASAGAEAYTIFDLDCVADPLPPACASSGVLWSQPSQDKSSNKTGSSVFDFEGDGQAEAVYGDECFLRVYNGANGEVLFSNPRSSCTWHEMPIIADVDGDYRTEIVIGSNLNCSVNCPTLDPIFPGLRCDENAQCTSGACVGGFCRCGSDDECSPGTLCSPMLPTHEDGQGQVCRAAHTGKIQGIQVYADNKDSWVYSRPIWNQHAYSVTNVHEDGTIPPREELLPNWTLPEGNHFRQNDQGSADKSTAPDLTVEFTGAPSCEGNAGITIPLEVCNRGGLAVAAGVPITLSYGDETASCATAEDMGPGLCTEVDCTFSGAVVFPASFSAQIDPDNGGQASTLECLETNNFAYAEQVTCP